MIVHELVASLEAQLGKLKVKKAVIGLRYACVILSNDSCGLAAVLDEGYRCSGYNWSAPLAGSSALELARGLLTADPILSSLGLATVNALLSRDAPLQEIEPIELLGINKDDVVGMVGNIAPLARQIACLLYTSIQQDRPSCYKTYVGTNSFSYVGIHLSLIHI